MITSHFNKIKSDIHSLVSSPFQRLNSLDEKTKQVAKKVFLTLACVSLGVAGACFAFSQTMPAVALLVASTVLFLASSLFHHLSKQNLSIPIAPQRRAPSRPSPVPTTTAPKKTAVKAIEIDPKEIKSLREKIQSTSEKIKSLKSELDHNDTKKQVAAFEEDLVNFMNKKYQAFSLIIKKERVSYQLAQLQQQASLLNADYETALQEEKEFDAALEAIVQAKLAKKETRELNQKLEELEVGRYNRLLLMKKYDKINEDINEICQELAEINLAEKLANFDVSAYANPQATAAQAKLTLVELLKEEENIKVEIEKARKELNCLEQKFKTLLSD